MVVTREAVARMVAVAGVAREWRRQEWQETVVVAGVARAAGGGDDDDGNRVL